MANNTVISSFDEAYMESPEFAIRRAMGETAEKMSDFKGQALTVNNFFCTPVTVKGKNHETGEDEDKDKVKTIMFVTDEKGDEHVVGTVSTCFYNDWSKVWKELDGISLTDYKIAVRPFDKQWRGMNLLGCGVLFGA